MVDISLIAALFAIAAFWIAFFLDCGMQQPPLGPYTRGWLTMIAGAFALGVAILGF